MDRDAVQLIIETIADAKRVNRYTFEGTNVIALPHDYRLHDLSQYLPGPLRQSGTFVTRDPAAFGEYVARHGDDDTPVYVDAENWQAVAVFNQGDQLQPGHSDNRAVLKVVFTYEYETLLFADGLHWTQEALTEWVEDNAACIRQFGSSEGMEVLNIGQALAAIRAIKVGSAKHSTHVTEDMRRERGVMESIEVANAAAFPGFMYYHCSPGLGLPEREFILRARVQTNHEKPAIHTRVVALKKAQADIANDFRALVDDAVPGTPYLGTYKPGP